MIRPGRFDERITFRAPVEAQDAAGAPLYSWSDYLTVWAEFTELGGSETARAGMPVAQMGARIKIRHPSNPIDTTMRIYRPQTSTLWAIEAISELPDGRRVGYEIRATNVDRTGATRGVAA